MLQNHLARAKSSNVDHQDTVSTLHVTLWSGFKIAKLCPTLSDPSPMLHEDIPELLLVHKLLLLERYFQSTVLRSPRSDAELFKRTDPRLHPRRLLLLLLREQPTQHTPAAHRLTDHSLVERLWRLLLLRGLRGWWLAGRKGCSGSGLERFQYGYGLGQDNGGVVPVSEQFVVVS